MIHLALAGLDLSATLLYWRETIAARGSDPSMLAAFAIVLACYNFLRCRRDLGAATARRSGRGGPRRAFMPQMRPAHEAS